MHSKYSPIIIINYQLIINDDHHKLSITTLECDCYIQELKFFQNFIGYFTSIIVLNKLPVDEYTTLLKHFKYGIYSEKHLRDLQKYANPSYLNNVDVKIISSVDLKEYEGFNFILDNMKILYTPTRVIDSSK